MPLEILLLNQLSTNVAWCFHEAALPRSIHISVDHFMLSKAVSLDFLATDIAINTRIFEDIIMNTLNVILQLVLQNILAAVLTVHSFI